jgi:hypothetical protein
MTLKHICFIGAAVVALNAGVVSAQARSTSEEDAVTRQLNLDQLDKAQSGENTMNRAPTPDSRDGQGGPEFQGPPGPNEGMTDEPPAKGDDAAPAPEDQAPADDNGPEPAPAPKPY